MGNSRPAYEYQGLDEHWWLEVLVSVGFRHAGHDTEGFYNLSDLHESHAGTNPDFIDIFTA